MQKKLFLSAAVVLGLAPASVLAAITLDERPIDFFNISAEANGDIVITTSENGSQPPNDDDPNDDDPSDDDPSDDDPNDDDPNDDDPNDDDPNDDDPNDDDPNGCPERPSNVTVTELMDWSKPQATIAVSLGANEIKSTPFTATDNPFYVARPSFAAASGTTNVRRDVWISYCEGGKTLVAEDPACFATATGLIGLTAIQQPTTQACSLEPGESYFINVQNKGCDKSSCGVRRLLWTNDKPWLP